jgi:radical SAM superfamily enzyme YgiQ (UPF0313 family)
MKVLLINPPITFSQKRRIGPVIKNLFYNSPPLGLGYLAAVLEKRNIPVKIIDAAVENLKISEIRNRYQKFRPDIVGITSTTYSFRSAIGIAGMIKDEKTDTKIIIGGPHATADPVSILAYKYFDIGVLGEGEVTLLELIDGLEGKHDLRDIEGIIFRRGSEIYFTKPRDYIENLDELPFPARHLLPLELYRPQPNDERAIPKLSMISSRGCPFGCIFCDKSVFGKRYRTFSPKYIVSEMEHLVRDFGAKDIAFLDSCFTVNKERVKSILTEMRNRNLKVSWTCTARVDVVTKDLLSDMKKTGCWRVRLGIESGNDNVLEFIKKGITKEQVRNATNWAAKVGLQPKGFFMIGHLTDTKESIEETIKFAKSLPLKDITVQINTPLKNTVQYGLYKEYGTLITNDNSKLSFFEPFFIPNGLTREYLNQIYRKFYRSWYLRPIVFWRHLKHLRGMGDVAKYLKSLVLLVYLFFGKNIGNKESANDPAN